MSCITANLTAHDRNGSKARITAPQHCCLLHLDRRTSPALMIASKCTLTLRPSGLSSPAFGDWLDYVVVDDGRDVGRIYGDRHTLPELRWFWSITVYVNPKLGILTSGRAPSIEEAKAQLLASWQKCRSTSRHSTSVDYGSSKQA